MINQKSAQLRFSVFELDRIIVSLLENLTNIKYVQNVKALFEMFSEASYNNDEDKAGRVYLIRKLADVILGQQLQSKDVLLNIISFDGRYADFAVNVLNTVYNQTISDKEAIALDKKISLLLKFAIIEQSSDKLINNVNNIKSENYDDLSAEIDSVENEINLIQKDLKTYRETIEEGNNTVSFDNSILGRIKRIIEKENSSTSTIKTGLKTFNDILGGGFKAGRVYCCMAPMKNFKSGLLLNACLWAKKYNKITPKNSSKKPIILYITLENSIDETIERVLGYCEGNNFDITKHSVQEIATILKAHGVFTPDDDADVGLEMLYKPNKSITVQDISTIIDDYYKAGKEVVFLAVDYIKRIRPSVITKDLRIDLGNIADELHVLAIEKDIPIFTAMQLNRAAISELDAAQSFEQKLAAFNKIGTSNVGESIDIPQNVDLCFTMVKTVDPKISEQGDVESIDKYLNVHVVATRYNIGDIDGFIHRFKEGNDMCLEEDAYSSVSKSIINKQSLIKDRVTDSGIKTRGARHV